MAAERNPERPPETSSLFEVTAPTNQAPVSTREVIRIRANLQYRLSNPSNASVVEVAQLVAAKDAPIIAAARTGRVKLAAIYDRGDLFSKRQGILTAFGVTVATPEEILTRLKLR